MDEEKGQDSGKMSQKEAQDYVTYVESEESLLEQIRSKEEELSRKIIAAEQVYAEELEAARKEREEIIERKRQAAQAEADAVWQEAMERIRTDIEQVRREGEQKLRLDRERQEKNFDSVVENVVQAVRNG